MVVGPWLFPEDFDRDLARHLRGVLANQVAFRGQYRWVPVPLKHYMLAFGPAARPMPVGALLRLWDELPEFGGHCRCGGPIRAYSTGGHWPGIGGLWGICLECDRKSFRGIGGDGAFQGLIAPVLKRTEFWVADEWDRDVWAGCERALPAVLRELGGPKTQRVVWLTR